MDTSITEGQRKQYLRFVEDTAILVLDESNLDKDAIQKLIENGGQFQKDFAALIQKHSITKITNQFADEEVKSNYTYPKEYKGPRPIDEQINSIAKILDLDPIQALEFSKNLPELPEGAEGWFAIPCVDALATKYFSEVTDPAEKYCRAIQLIHKKIAESRSFYNYRDGEITPKHLRIHARTAHALSVVAEQQKGDILIIACQLGMRHRGRSVRRAREVFTAYEFGLGSVPIGAIALTHPERFVRYEELDIDCAGDELAPDADGAFSGAPIMSFSDDKVKFDTFYVGYTYGSYGAGSGFLPQ